MPKIDLASLKVAAGVGNLNEKMDQILEGCSPEDPPYLSDLLINYNDGGMFVMQALEGRYNTDRNRPENQRFKWRINCFRDEWGNIPQPGDVVIKRQQKPFIKPDGKAPTSVELSNDKRSGVYEKKWIDEIEYLVDEKGCIACEFQDAVYFLREFGVHGESGAPMSKHARASTKEYERYERNELSQRPTEAPDGNHLHVWYWRCKEVNREQYAALKEPEKQNGPKRGKSK